MRRKLMAMLLGTTMMAALGVPATAAQSQKSMRGSEAELRRIIQAQQRQIDELKTRLDAMQAQQAASAQVNRQLEEANAGAEFLNAQVEAQQQQIAELKKATSAATPSFRGAPQFSNGAGFSFKPRGRLHYDAAYVSNPGDLIATKDLGFSTRVRRVRLGAEGSFAGDFEYQVEADFANSAVSLADVYLTYRPKGAPWEATVGHVFTLNGLEQMTSSNRSSFVERAQFVEAFNNGRRLGAQIGYIGMDDQLRLHVGAFNDTVNADRSNDDYVLAARAVYAPKALGGQLHFGLNYQYRRAQSNQLAFTYQSRPFVQNTDTRFVSTGNLAARGDQVFGIEAAGIFGPLHVAAEGQLLKVDTIKPGDVLTSGDASSGARILGDPRFFGFYAETGYWLTGETRGYRDGLWQRTRVKNGFDKGGPGAVQLNVRYEHLDLSDQVAGGGSPLAFIDGGRQIGYLASLVWQPIDYVRFTAQYGRGEVRGGPRAATVVPQSLLPAADRGYGFDMVALRTAFDF